MRWIKKLDRAPLRDSLIQFARLVGREQAGGTQGNMHTWNEEAGKVRGEEFTWREEGRRRGGGHGIVTCGCAGGHSDAIESVYYPREWCQPVPTPTRHWPGDQPDPQVDLTFCTCLPLAGRCSCPPWLCQSLSKGSRVTLSPWKELQRPQSTRVTVLLLLPLLTA